MDTTIRTLDDGSIFVFTGDIPAMWLRDSSAQVRPYMRFASKQPHLAEMLKKLIQRQLLCIEIDPYANAFNESANGKGHKDKTENNDWVWERKYEIDSLCYPLHLAHQWWKETGSEDLFNDQFLRVAECVLDLWTTEQNHERSPYCFEREHCPPSDTLSHDGSGAPVAWTGMTWSGFRPSDDACRYGYLVPSNMFAVVVLDCLEEIFSKIFKNKKLRDKSKALRCDIQNGIQKYAIQDHPQYGSVYAYEVDGLGHYHFMDDANVPSLLAIPYLGYAPVHDPIYQNTRAMILSESNPFYYQGRYASGIGSPHTPSQHVWPISLIIQGLTTTDAQEREQVIKTLLATDADTGYMHESFDCDHPQTFTREWFSWANALFAELIIHHVESVHGRIEL
ncbi:MAG: glycoside hydrolase family 125 protein [Spirochaetales bacterium]|nr:glycoside hydrolase family 125 protein [Spirochaetales bacterium]